MGLATLIVITFLLIQVSIQHSIAPRFTNGRRTVRNKFPFVVSLQAAVKIENFFAHICTGAAIHPQWIISTGFCVKKITERISSPRVKIGMHYTGEESVFVQTVEVLNRAIYELYKIMSRSQNNNIGLLRVTRIKNSVFIIIPQPDPNLSTSEVTMIGWVRSLEGDGTVREVMQYIDVILLDSEQCMERFPDLQDIPLDNSQFCVYLPDTSITLTDIDMGGPIVHYVNDKPELIGLISMDYDPPGSLITPIICTNISHFYGWSELKQFLVN